MTLCTYIFAKSNIFEIMEFGDQKAIIIPVIFVLWENIKGFLWQGIENQGPY
jgi:hypothetical protein